VADRLTDKPHPVLHQWLEEKGVTIDDLGEAAGAYCRFINLAHGKTESGEQDDEQAALDWSMVKCLEKSGWNAVKPEAQVAYMFYAGALITGTFFKGIREAIPENDNRKLPVLDDLNQAARQLEAYVSMSGWKRWLCRWSKWFNRMFLRAKAVRRPV